MSSIDDFRKKKKKMATFIKREKLKKKNLGEGLQ